MSRPLLLLTSLMVMDATGVASAQYIWVNLSVKVVLNPIDGRRSPAVTDAAIDQIIGGMNGLLAGYERGYRILRPDPVSEVGGLGDTTGPSQFYDKDMLANHDEQKKKMETEALNNPALYRWSTTRINLYITGWTTGGCPGVSSLPGDNQSIVVISACAITNQYSALVLHELGHYFNLLHTHEGDQCCDRTKNPGCPYVFGDDLIDDTLPDAQCANQDDIAFHFFGVTYASLNASQKNQVDDVFNNLMSYHSNQQRLTEHQLDRWTDTANYARLAVVTGRTFFVDGGCFTPLLAQDGSSQCGFLSGPYQDLFVPLTLAAPGDIILIRPGSYFQPSLTTHVTLRATRAGPVTLYR